VWISSGEVGANAVLRDGVAGYEEEMRRDGFRAVAG
jgi:hypothetical protein